MTKTIEIPDNIEIHRTAVVSETAKLSKGVKIGPYSIIGDNVSIGENTIIKSHVVIENDVTIGKNCSFFTGAVIGSESQDLKSLNEKSYVVIGDNNTFREYVTVNRASYLEEKTVIGNNNLFMAYVHIAHDCIIGDSNIIANSVNMGGHCVIEDHAVIGGLTGIHQFVRVGSYAMIGGLTRVSRDIPPFFTTVGNPALVEGLNLKGLRRQNFPKEKILALKKAYELIYKSDLSLKEALSQIKSLYKYEEIDYLVAFYINSSKRGISGLENVYK